MNRTKKLILVVTSSAAVCLATGVGASIAMAAPVQDTQQAAQQSLVRQVGTITSVSSDSVKIKTDAGVEIAVTITPGARILRAVPGQKDLSTAAVITLQDLQVGDRILVRGKAGDANSIAAQTVVAMKSEDIAKKQERERMDWQRRGVGGLVKSVDPSTGVVTISTTSLGSSKSVAVKVTPHTIVRRYAADSVKFDDAKIATLADVKAGDQLRARGTKNEDGTELTAEEIVSGTFRNIAGTIISIDAANGTLKVMDLATKKPVDVKITGESQMRKLPAMAAQMIAARLKGGAAQGMGGAGAPQGGAPAGAPGAHMGQAGGPPAGFAGAGGQRPNGRGDFQQVLASMPAATLADLSKNDAVMIVTTQGSDTVNPVAITLLGGVEPILTASPTGGAPATILSPWNLSGGGEGEAQ